MSDEKQTKALADECQRQSESCNYTYVTFIVWLRYLRCFQISLILAPIAFGALATWKITSQTSPVLGAIFALLATVLPLLYRESKIDKTIDNYASLAGEFANLRDRFRQLALIYSHNSFSAFEAAARPIFDRQEKARSRSFTPPEFCFKIAQRKIHAGHYQHDFDQRKLEETS